MWMWMCAFIRTKEQVEKKIYILNHRCFRDITNIRQFVIHLQKALVLLSNNHVPPQTTWHPLVLWTGEVQFLFSNNAGKESLLRGWPMWYNIYEILKTMHRKSVIHFFFWGQIVVHCCANANLEINVFYGAGPWLGISGNSGTKGRGFTVGYYRFYSS